MRTPDTKMMLCALGLGLLLSAACDGSQQADGAGGADEAKKSAASKTSGHEKTGEPKVRSSKHPVIGDYFDCYDSCASKSEDDRSTCHKNCAASVTAGSGDPAASACPRACTEELGSCLSPCDAKNEDDSATCRRQCQQLAEKCVDGCV